MGLKNRKPKLDYLYKSELMTKFINHLMCDGKKSVASRVFYDALELMKKKIEMTPKTDSKSNKDPVVEVFEIAIGNIKPNWEVKSQRIGGSTYQIPSEIREERKESLAIRWLIKAARAKKGKSIVRSLSEELVDAFNNTGAAHKKKEDTHKTAEANRAFAHYGRN